MPRSRRSPDDYLGDIGKEALPVTRYGTPRGEERKTENPIRRERVAKTWTNPYEDGLPDWPELIAGLTQHQRDAILDRLPKKPGRV